MDYLGTLGPKMKAFLVADALLLLAFVVVLVLFLAGGLGGSGGEADDPSSASTKDTSAPGSPTQTDTTSFASPTGNIACEITDDAATCTIADSSATPPADASCAGVVGLELRVTAEGASMPCVEGTPPGRASSDVPELAYGQSKTVGDFTCTSSSTGVRCKHDPSGEGFKLARAGAELTPS